MHVPISIEQDVNVIRLCSTGPKHPAATVADCRQRFFDERSLFEREDNRFGEHGGLDESLA